MPHNHTVAARERRRASKWDRCIKFVNEELVKEIARLKRGSDAITISSGWFRQMYVKLFGDAPSRDLFSRFMSCIKIVLSRYGIDLVLRRNPRNAYYVVLDNHSNPIWMRRSTPIPKYAFILDDILDLLIKVVSNVESYAMNRNGEFITFLIPRDEIADLAKRFNIPIRHPVQSVELAIRNLLMRAGVPYSNISIRHDKVKFMVRKDYIDDLRKKLEEFKREL